MTKSKNILIGKNSLIFLISMLLFCNSNITYANEDNDILDIVMPAILASINSQKLTTLEQLGKLSGISMTEIDHIRVGNSTDPFTPPQLKTMCSKIHDTGVGIKFCTEYATYTRVMNCEWYLDAPISSSMRFQVADAQEKYEKFIEDFTRYAKEKISIAIVDALTDGAVSAAIAGLLSYGMAAAPAFIKTFVVSLDLRLIKALALIGEFIKVNGENFANLYDSSMPVITSDNLRQSCGWSEWKIL